MFLQFLSASANTISDEFLAYIVMLMIPVFFLILSIVSYKRTKKMKKALKENKQQLLSKNDAIDYVALTHTTGLPIAEDAPCGLLLKADSLEISGGGTTFNLPKSRILSVSEKTDVDVQKQYVSSTGRAIAGGLMFGAVGAAVGGRAKKKETKTTTLYLVVTYKKDADVAYLMFKIGAYTNKETRNFINNLKSGIQTQDVKIDL